MSHANRVALSLTGGPTRKDGMAESEPRQDAKSPQDARLASLDERLRQAQADEAERTRQPKRAQGRGQAQGMRILSVLIAYPFGSALIGYAIDRIAGTSGIWVAMLFLGFGAAMWQVWKVSQQSPQ
ncbi:MAG TPA: AtpZ/AtpI family protein [Allosphingosinicella sp.]|jgi:ATP synthase protein I